MHQEANCEETCAKSTIFVLAALASDGIQFFIVLALVSNVLDLNVSLIPSLHPVSSFSDCSLFICILQDTLFTIIHGCLIVWNST
jgi:hypothetical protein